ncbi:MAG: aminotransferase, partial [Paracoccaceae bacterium]
MTPELIERLRRETPSCERLLHFNNAGASLMPDPVYRAVTDHLALERAVGGYEAAAQALGALAGFYTSFARLLGCEPTEIAYAENATRAWDMAFYGAGLG